MNALCPCVYVCVAVHMCVHAGVYLRVYACVCCRFQAGTQSTELSPFSSSSLNPILPYLTTKLCAVFLTISQGLSLFKLTPLHTSFRGGERLRKLVGNIQQSHEL